jgi:hypothetical protein
MVVMCKECHQWAKDYAQGIEHDSFGRRPLKMASYCLQVESLGFVFNNPLASALNHGGRGLPDFDPKVLR